MPTQEDRIATLEQTTISRIEFINAINRLTLQQAQNASDMSHEVTILLGVTGSQGQDIRVIKEDVNAIKGDVNAIKGDVRAITERLDRLETNFDEHTSLLTQHTSLLTQHTSLLKQILERLPEKS